MDDRYKEYLEWFVGEMVEKLDENNHKGTWKDLTFNKLLDLLDDEVSELEDEVSELNPNYENIIKECADVANFAMMVAERAKASIK